MLLFLLLFFNVYLFILRERMCTHEQGSGREREWESQPGSMLSMESDLGLNPTNCEIMAWTEIKSRTLNWLSHQGVPCAPLPKYEAYVMVFMSQAHLVFHIFQTLMFVNVYNWFVLLFCIVSKPTVAYSQGHTLTVITMVYSVAHILAWLTVIQAYFCCC